MKTKSVQKSKIIVVAMLLGLVTMLMLVACGESNTDTNSPQTTAANSTASANKAAANKIAPCDLIAKADVEAVLGPVVSSKTSQQGPATICSYSVQQDNVNLKSVLISIDSYDSSKSSFESSVNSSARFYETEAKSISGIGDSAYSVTNDFLFVLKNKTSFNIYFPFARGDKAATEKASLLAAKAVERL